MFVAIMLSAILILTLWKEHFFQTKGSALTMEVIVAFGKVVEVTLGAVVLTWT